MAAMPQRSLEGWDQLFLAPSRASTSKLTSR